MTPSNRETHTSSDELATPRALNPKVEDELRGGFDIGPHFEMLRRKYPQDGNAKIISSAFTEK